MHLQRYIPLQHKCKNNVYNNEQMVSKNCGLGLEKLLKIVNCKNNFGVNHMRKDLCQRVSNQLVWFIVRTSCVDSNQ